LNRAAQVGVLKKEVTCCEEHGTTKNLQLLVAVH
jgi:hypothetical protein